MPDQNCIQLPQEVISFNNLKLAFKRTLKINDDLIIDHLSVDKAQGRSLMAAHNISPSLYRYLCLRAMNNDFPSEVPSEMTLEAFKSLQKQVNYSVKEYLINLHKNLQRGWIPQDSISIAEPKANYTERIKVRLCLDDAVVYQALVNVIIPQAYEQLASLMNLEDKTTINKLNEQKLRLGKALPYQVLSNHLEPVAKLGEKLFKLGQGSIDYKSNKDKFTYHCFQNYYPQWQQYESFYKGGVSSPKLQERYLLKADFTAFYDCVNHSRLFKILQECFEVSEEICMALRAGFASWQRVDQDLLPGVGLPQGYLASSLLSECYLYPFDLAMQTIAQQGYLIRRYVDDVAVITSNRETAKLGQEGLKVIVSRLSHHARSLGLHLNQSKLSITKLAPWKAEQETRVGSVLYWANLRAQHEYMKVSKAFNLLKQGGLSKLLKLDLNFHTTMSIQSLSKGIRLLTEKLSDQSKSILNEAGIVDLMTLQAYYLYRIIPLFKKQNALYYEGWLGTRVSSKAKRQYDLFLFKLEQEAVALQKLINNAYSLMENVEKTDTRPDLKSDLKSDPEQDQWQNLQVLYQKFLVESGLMQLEQAQREGIRSLKLQISSERWGPWVKSLLNAIRRRLYHRHTQNIDEDNYQDILIDLARVDICQVGASLRLLNRYSHSSALINNLIDTAAQYKQFEGVRYAVYEHLSDANWSKGIECEPIFDQLLKIERLAPSMIGFMGLVELATRQDAERLISYLQKLKANNEPLLRAVHQFFRKSG